MKQRVTHFSFIAVLSLASVLAGVLNAASLPTTHLQDASVAPGQEQSTWGKSYGGADKSYDSELLRLREEIAPRFQTLDFADKVTGRTMAYNLYVPKNYDANTTSALELFMADGSTTGKGAQAPLKQGYGGIIWATVESPDTTSLLRPCPRLPGA